MLLSTFSGHVEAMGGELNLVAEFPDRPPVRLQMLERLAKRGAKRSKPRGRDTPPNALVAGVMN